MTDDIEAIAKGLSGAQRAIVIGSEPGGFGNPDIACGCEIRGAGHYSAAKALERKGLGEVEYYDNISTLYWNNTDGLAVRQYLMDRKDG